MVKGVLRGGLIYPLGPLPREWHDGLEVRLEEAETAGVNGDQPLDEWYAALQSQCAASDPEDDRRLATALAQAHEQAKELVRRRMGLPE